MADANWSPIANDAGYKVWQATINSTDTKTKILVIKRMAKGTTIFIDLGAGETAIQIKAHNNPKATEAELIVLTGGDAIAADFDDTIAVGTAAIQVSGATTVNDTVITLTEVQ